MWQVLSRSSDAPVSVLRLAPDERFELMLSARLQQSSGASGAALPQGVLPLGLLHVRSVGGAADAEAEDASEPHGLLDGDGVAGGGYRADELHDTIVLLGWLRQVASFSLNVGHLNFRGLPQRQASSHPLASPRPLPKLAPQLEVFWLRNLSAEQPLELSLRVEGLAQIAEVHVEPSALQLAPSAEAQVHVHLTPLVVRHEASDDAEALRVVVSDVHSLACSQALSIALVEWQPTESGEAVGARSGESQRVPRALLDGLEQGAEPFQLDGSPSGPRAAAKLALPRSADSFSLDADSPPLLGLRGATPVSGSSRRYEVNLGMQTFASGAVQWELGVENLGESPLRYRLYTMGTEQGAEWLNFSRTEGVLRETHETHMLNLHCSTQQLDIYPTYVVIDNLDNPDDLKTVRVTMETVVADGAASTYFSVVVDGQGTTPVPAAQPAAPARSLSSQGGADAGTNKGMQIHLGDIYYDTVYVNRSFVIENHSSMPLDFVLSHNKQRDAETEINFSLSNTALKVFSTLLVPAHSSRRVFLHFRTSQPLASPATTPSSGAATAAVAAAPAASGGSGAVEAPSPQRGADTHFAHVLHGGRSSVAGLLGPAHMQIEISVSCRLVKDHCETILLHACCHPSRLALSQSELVFSLPARNGGGGSSGSGSGGGGGGGTGGGGNNGGSSSGGGGTASAIAASSGSGSGGGGSLHDVLDAKRGGGGIGAVLAAALSPRQVTIEVANLGSAPLRFAVRSSCVFFHVITEDPDSEEQVVEPGATTAHTIRVTPNERAIAAHGAQLLKARYVEQHFTVYNLDDLNEHKYVLVRLTSASSQFTQGFSYTPAKFMHGYSLLEEDILRFNCAFQTFWQRDIVLPAATAARAACVEDGGDGGDGGGDGGGGGGGGGGGLLVPERARSAPESSLAGSVAGGEAGGRTGQLLEHQSAMLARLASLEGTGSYFQLWFDFRHLTDELVFYGMKVLCMDAHGMCMVCTWTWHVHSMCTACVWHAHCMLVICTWLVFYARAGADLALRLAARQPRLQDALLLRSLRGPVVGRQLAR